LTTCNSDVQPVVHGPADISAVLPATLTRQAEEIMASLIAPASSCALLDYPLHANVGDNAIWLGEQRVLRTLRARVVYTADQSAYDRGRLADRLAGAGTILLHGGGNLGDLWPEHQRFREEVIAAFPDYPIIQLPQSICFRDPAALRRAKEVFDRHPNLTLLVRDQRSFEIARNAFRARSILCPDMALALGELERSGAPHFDVLALCRSDHESAGKAPPAGPKRWKFEDWVTAPWEFRGGVWRALRRLNRCHQMLGRWCSGLSNHYYELLARERLEHGRRLLSLGRVVVTDRLHGHVLSLLMGVPHVIMDDRYGKIRSFYETWTRQSTLAVFVDAPGAAAGAAAALASVRSMSGRGTATAPSP
jgi:exopolysaccharide biosynthesis predicted pyruvyltransferase EpsI